MGRRKVSRARPLKPFETLGGENRMVAANFSLFFHPAFLSLSASQKLLYMCMSSVRFNMTREERNYIAEVYGGNEALFFFSQGRWYTPKESTADRKYYCYCLYRSRSAFYADRNMLIEHGLIETVESNRHRHEKNLYRFSDKWKEYTPKAYEPKHRFPKKGPKEEPGRIATIDNMLEYPDEFEFPDELPFN